MKADINRLIARPPADKRLDPAQTPEAIRAQTGLERKQAADLNSETITAVSTDGLFTFVVRVVKP